MASFREKNNFGKDVYFPYVMFFMFLCFITLESWISDSKTFLYFSHLFGTCFHVLRLHDNFALKKIYPETSYIVSSCAPCDCSQCIYNTTCVYMAHPHHGGTAAFHTERNDCIKDRMYTFIQKRTSGKRDARKSLLHFLFLFLKIDYNSFLGFLISRAFLTGYAMVCRKKYGGWRCFCLFFFFFSFFFSLSPSFFSRNHFPLQFIPSPRLPLPNK